MPSTRTFRALVASLTLFAVTTTFTAEIASAQSEKPEKGPAYTEPPKKDPNYPLMGEFLGRVRLGEDNETKEQLALQIRPVAGDQFRAIAFYGGLPGQEDHKSDEMQLIGLRSENNVVLSGGPWAIFVDPEGCSIISSKGKMLGRLSRVNRISPTLGAQAPEGATVLFDGSNVDHFVGAEMTENGLLKQGALISPMFQDFNLHVEFRLPYMPKADGQQRGNSGLYLQSRYECQVLDSFGTERMFNGLGALYRMKSPEVNMAFPPLVWQTYDIQFTAPRWASDGSKIREAHVTSWVNGVKVQDNVALPSKTGAGKQEEPTLLPINIQDHGDPVRFRNIWIVDRGLTTTEFPVIATKAQRQDAAKLEWNEKPKAEPESKDQDKKAEPKQADAESKAESKADDSKPNDSAEKTTEKKTESDQTDANADVDTKPEAKSDDKASSDDAK